MRVLYIGVTEANAGWGQEWFIIRALRDMGVEVLSLDYRLNRHKVASHLRRMARARVDFDAFVLHKGDTFPVELVHAIRRPRVYIAPDLVARQRAQDKHLGSGLFQMYLVRGNECAESLLNSRWAEPEEIRVFYSGCDPTSHYREPDAASDVDVVFVGSATPRRRSALDSVAARFKVIKTRAFGDTMRHLFNRGKVVLNVHADDDLDVENRVYEVLGCGGFLLTERLLPSSPFEDGVHLVEYDTIQECNDLIEYYLAHDAERRTIAEQGHNECHARHTYLDRARDLLDAILVATARTTSKGPAIDLTAVNEYLPREMVLRGYAKVTTFVRTAGARVKRAARRATGRAHQPTSDSEW